MIAQPYLLFIGDVTLKSDAKTAFGLRDWTTGACLAQLRLPGCQVDLELPEMSPDEAVRAGAKTLVIGVAPVGGRIPQAWLPVLEGALEAGLDLAAGLHDRLGGNEKLVALARQHGRRLHDVRIPARDYAVASGRKRSGKRLLTVGTDCALGKKYTALAIAHELTRRGYDATFRATGQTGILISGSGIPIDSIVADFVAGAAEALSPDADAAHWDIIEGQGAINHPGYAAVTLGLVHGSQPDVMVLCHDPARREIEDYPGFVIPPLERVMALYLDAARLTNPNARFVGVSLNTSAFSEARANELLAEARSQCGLPCIDPLRTGAGPIVGFLEHAEWT